MPILTLILIAILILVVVFGLIVVLGDHFGDVETCTISTRELPNVAADIGTPDSTASDRDRARRQTT